MHVHLLAVTLLSALLAAPLALTPSAVADESESEAPAEAAPVFVLLETSKGDILLELDAAKAPISVENFVGYVDDGFYDGLIFHRVIRDFMIQGGGFNESMTQAKTKDPIKNEASNGLKNARGTIAMARLSGADTASSQFFINVQDNASLDPNDTLGRVGYAVFGRVVDGMEVVDAIREVPTVRVNRMNDVPAEPVTIKKAKRLDAAAAKKRMSAPKTPKAAD